MNCRRVEDWMDRALDGSGSGRTSTLPGEASEHLRACPRCRTQWELLVAADAALRVPRPVPAPPDLLARFQERLEREAPPEPRPTWRAPWVWSLGGLAGAGLAAAVVLAVGLPQPTPRDVSAGMSQQDMALSARSAPPGGGVPERTLESAAPALSGSPSFAPPPTVAATREPAGSAAPDSPPAAAPTVRAADPGLAGTGGARAAGGAIPSIAAAEGTGTGAGKPAVPRAPTPLSNRAIGPEERETVLGARLHISASESAARARGTEKSRAEGTPPGLPAGPLPGALAQQQTHIAATRDTVAISPALLTALRTPVTLSLQGVVLGDALKQLGEASQLSAEVVGREQQPVTVTAMNQPCWLVLQEMAQQAGMTIYPAETGVVLRGAMESLPLGTPVPNGGAPGRSGAAGPPGPPGPPGPGALPAQAGRGGAPAGPVGSGGFGAALGPAAAGGLGGGLSATPPRPTDEGNVRVTAPRRALDNLGVPPRARQSTNRIPVGDGSRASLQRQQQQGTHQNRGMAREEAVPQMTRNVASLKPDPKVWAGSWGPYIRNGFPVPASAGGLQPAAPVPGGGAAPPR